jgi:transporter family-2 protein
MIGVVIFGVVAALFTGIAIGVQSALSSRVGTLIGNIRTGVLTNALGGLIAILLFLVLLLINGKGFWQIPGTALTMLVIAGALGILIITGVAFSLQRTGVAAGLATIILGQLVVSVIIDTKGYGGVPPIPITLPRILGLIVMAAGVYLLLPKK